MVAAGFKPSSQKATQDFWTQKISTPTLHMIGMEDSLITPELQQTLVDQCIDPVVIRHNGGYGKKKESVDLNKFILKYFFL